MSVFPRKCCFVITWSVSYFLQGRLEPVEALVKKNKRGLGADLPKKAVNHTEVHDGKDAKVSSLPLEDYFQLFDLYFNYVIYGSS